MNDEAERICEEMDAALFSGDTFFDVESTKELRVLLERWRRRLDEIDHCLNQTPS